MEPRTNTNRETPMNQASHEDDDREVHELLEGVAEAMVAGDIEACAEYWAMPALVIGDELAKAIASEKDLREAFGGAKEHYNARGITSTRPDVADIRWVSDRVCMVEVRWPYLDAQNREMGHETSTYTLRKNESNKLKIRCAVMHAAPQPH